MAVVISVTPPPLYPGCVPPLNHAAEAPVSNRASAEPRRGGAGVEPRPAIDVGLGEEREVLARAAVRVPPGHHRILDAVVAIAGAPGHAVDDEGLERAGVALHVLRADRLEVRVEP